jgi:hypothetical protein
MLILLKFCVCEREWRDSFITQEVFAPGTGNEENRVTINPTPGANPNVLIVNTGRFTTVQTDSIVASRYWLCYYAYGNVNNQALFYDPATFLDTVNINGALYDQNSSSGTAGQAD